MLCRTHKNHPSVPSCFAKFFKYLWLWGNARSEIYHFNNTRGFQMLGIRMQLLQEPKVLVFLRTAARHLQCPCVLKPQQRAGTGATRESKAAVLFPHKAGRQSLWNAPGIQSKAQMRLKWCQVLAVVFSLSPHAMLVINISARCCMRRASTWHNMQSSARMQC